MDGGEAAGPPAHVVAAPPVPGGGHGRSVVDAEESVLAGLDQHQVTDDDPGQGEEERAGRGRKPRTWPSGVKGTTAPAMTTPNAASSSGTLGPLRKNGIRLVRITNITRVWVARDSTNQPEPEQYRAALEHPQHDAESDEVEHRAAGPKKSMNRRMKLTSQRVGRVTSSGSTSSVGRP